MEEQKNNKFLLGIIGATIGAFIGTIPWILMYIYGNLIVAILSVLIAIGSYQGYKLTKAAIDKKLPIIVAVTSVVAVTVATFIIIPLALLAKEDLGATFENLEIIYNESEFTSAIIGDYVISLIFTAVGISGIVSNLHKQIKDGVTREELKINVSNTQQLVQPEELQAAKDVFVKYDALSKNNTVTKEEVVQDLSTQIPESRANEVFNLLKTQQIIRKSGGRYYFSEKAQNSNLARNGKSIVIAVAIILVVVVLMVVLAVANSNSSTNSKNKTSKYNVNNTIDIDMDEINQNLNEISENISNINNSINNTTGGNSTSNTTSDNEENETTSTEYEEEHAIDVAGMNFIPKDDLLILTDEEIETYYGAEYTAYEIIAMDLEGTRILYCFIDEDVSIKDLSAEEFLEETLTGSDYDEIKTVDIAGFEFATTQLSFEQSGEKYLEDCYVYKVDGKFVCFDYCYLDGETSSFEKMIEKK